MTKDSDDLAPCPFCGDEVNLIEGEESAYIQCTGMSMHRALWFSGDNDAANVVITEWNKLKER